MSIRNLKIAAVLSLGLCSMLSPRADASEIVVNGNRVNTSRNCKGENVVINGNDNTINLRGQCKSLTVTGNRNKIKTDAINSISTPGNRNKIGWHRGKPAISNVGNGNLIYHLK